MTCNHYWTVTSPCPACLQDELRREMVSNAELNDEIAKLREAIAAWPKLAHIDGCAARFRCGDECCTCATQIVCICTAGKANIARAEARRAAGLDDENPA